MRTALLKRFTPKNRITTDNPFLKPSFQPSRIIYYDEPKFVSETMVRNVILREELPRKSRLFFLQLTFINSSLSDRYFIHTHNRSMFMSYDNPS